VNKLALIIPIVAALQGAAGVGLAASAAHLQSAATLATASQFLMIHACAGLALAALAHSRAPARALCLVTITLQFGVTLFALDLTVRAFGMARLFPMAAPLGGSITLLSWLALAGVLTAPLFARRENPHGAD
jgi:uncharacterized membrane protein YgdD (TMEM256/DUF423 family)